MFRGFFRTNSKKSKIQSARHSNDHGYPQQEDFEIEIYTEAKKNVNNIKRMLNSPADLSVREFTIGEINLICMIVCIDGLVDKNLINDKVIKPIQNIKVKETLPKSAENILTWLGSHVISANEFHVVQTLDDVSLSILSGDTALMIDGTDQVIIISSRGFETRSIEEPVSEGLVRGPRVGFTENIQTNTMLIRRHFRDPNLRFDSMIIGRRSKKTLIISYIDGIVHPDLVKEVKRRVSSIDMDDVPESGFIEQWIEDSFLSPFPQVQHTERPDKVSASLMGGKVAILLDGTPFVLILPVTIGALFQSPEDYYERWQIGTLLRLLRFIAAFIALFLPSLYIALTEYHPGMLPSQLAFSIAGSREGVPFPAVVEAFMMEGTIELLREAGIRLPKPIGQTIGIVGGLVIGEAAVSAGIVSPVMVIIVAVTAISSFTLPAYDFAISLRIMRFGTMLAAAFLGLYGVIVCYIAINIHIANLKSFGVPYTTPFAPMFSRDMKDLVLRAPLTMMTKRPRMMQTRDTNRADTGGKRK